MKLICESWSRGNWQLRMLNVLLATSFDWASMKFILFADDLLTYFIRNHSLSELENIIIKELEYLSAWFKSNKLSLNINKTNYTLFRNKNKMVKTQLNIVIDGVNINQVNNTKFLGLYIDESLTWVNHRTSHRTLYWWIINICESYNPHSIEDLQKYWYN